MARFIYKRNGENRGEVEKRRSDEYRSEKDKRKEGYTTDFWGEGWMDGWRDT